jgi:hypothetical protein
VKLHYRNTVDDLVAFTRFFFQRSPLLRQQARFLASIGFCILTGGTVAFYLVIGTGTPPPPLDRVLLTLPCFVLPIVAIAAAIYHVWPYCLLYRVSLSTRQFYRNNLDRSALVDQELELIAGQLVARSELCAAYWKFSAIDEIATTPQHVFIRISGSRAFILPRRDIAEQDLASFITELERQRGAPFEMSPPPSPPSEAIQVDKSSIQL